MKQFIEYDQQGNILRIITTTDPSISLQDNWLEITSLSNKDDLLANIGKYKINIVNNIPQVVLRDVPISVTLLT